MKKMLFILALIASLNIHSQDDFSSLQRLIGNDSSSVRLLFSYPESIRTVIFNVATYPQGFTRLEEIQKGTTASFKKAVSKYNQNKQKQLWDVTRYPDLIPLLIRNKDKSESELAELMKNYPQKTRNAALYFVKHDYPILIEIENIRQDFETKYKVLVKDFPGNVQNSFDKLLYTPELISILSGDIRTTVALGDLYKQNPNLLKHIADSVNMQITKENKEEYEQWKSGISKDPNVQKDLKQISKEYTENGGDQDDVYDQGNMNNNGSGYNESQVDNAPYPYWAGYPYWYDTPYWYPYPWWYHTGFYWNPVGIAFYGLPSYHFGWWYYSHPNYYRRYPSATGYFNNHYQNYPRSVGGFTRSIRSWNGAEGHGGFGGHGGGFGGRGGGGRH